MWLSGGWPRRRDGQPVQCFQRATHTLNASQNATCCPGCCASLLGVCRGLCSKHPPYPALRLQHSDRRLEAESVLLPAHHAIAHLTHRHHTGIWWQASRDYERWLKRTLELPELEQPLRAIMTSRRNRAEPTERVVVMHRDERLESQDGDYRIGEWAPSQLPWVNSVKTTRCISKRCVNIHHVVYGTQQHNASTGSSKRQKLNRTMRYVH